MKLPVASAAGSLLGLVGGSLATYFAIYNPGTRETFFNAILNAPEYLLGFPALAGLFVGFGGLVPTGAAIGSHIGGYIGRRLSNYRRDSDRNIWKNVEPYNFRKG